MKDLDIKWLQEYAEQEKRYKWGKQIKLLLTAYEKEKETSHYNQSQLDIANAKLVEEKEKNKELSDKLIEKICKGVEEEILEEYRQIIIDKDKLIEELKKYKK